MSSSATILVHASQFPEAIRRELVRSLRTRRVNHKFHYDSVKQTRQWLAVHEQFSPARRDRQVASVYNRAFACAAAEISRRRIHLIGLGCGSGHKDAALVRLLKAKGREVRYTPCDVSGAMTLVARRRLMALLPEENCFPTVCDLALARDLATLLRRQTPARAERIITFFGMIPNFEPNIILPRLKTLVGRDDTLLFSANLAPGTDYPAGVQRILPQYDNPPTRAWLMAFLLDRGVGERDGELRFAVEGGQGGLKRVVARFRFKRARTVSVDNDTVRFHAGDSVRLFFSYRYTPMLVRRVLARHGLVVAREWIARSEEEGVFLCRRRERGAPAPRDGFV